MEKRTCKYCGLEKPIEQFHRNQWGYTTVCSQCNSERVKKGLKAALNGEHNEWMRLSKNRKRILELEEEVKRLETEVEKAKETSLDRYTPRELFTYIKKLGYKWEKMTYVRIEEVDWNKI